MFRPSPSSVAVPLLLLASCLVSAQESSSDTAKELIRKEQVRTTIEDALETIFTGAEDGEILPDIIEAADRVSELGDDAVPILAVEIEQQNPGTFFWAAYTLGRIGTPRAAETLREAIRAAEEQRHGAWPAMRKAWACWGLGIMRDPESVALVNQGRHLSGVTPLYTDLTVLEAISVMTAPESAPLLREQLATIDDEADPRMTVRAKVLAAIRRVADPQATELLTGLLEEGHPVLRREAAHALGAIEDPAAQRTLIEYIDIPDPRIRRGVALGLAVRPPTEGIDRVVDRLAVEDDRVIRGILYDVVARGAGAAGTDALLGFWGRPDGLDRARLVALLPRLDRDAVQPVLEQAMRDPEPAVVFAAVEAAVRLGDDAAIDLLVDAVSAPDWLNAQPAIQALARLGVVRSGDAIAARLIDDQLASVITDPRERARVTILSDALVALGHDKRLNELREASARQTDAEIVAQLESTIADLELIAANGNKRKRWLETLESAERRERELAYAWFARRGDARGVESMVQSFGRVEPDEGIEILEALGELDAPASRALLERVLTGPGFDPDPREKLRDAAAWSARRLDMRDTLTAAVERRDGRDWVPLVYAVLLSSRDDAAALIERVYLPRLDYPSTTRGQELDELDWMRGELAAGRSLDDLDAPPDKIRF